MQLSIKELDDANQNLQTELNLKEDLYNHLKLDYERLENKL